MLKHLASPALRGLLGLMVLGVSLGAQAQWKWRDANGKIQYSDLAPPPSTPEKDILQRPPGHKLQVFVIPPGGVAASAPAAKASAPSKAELDQQTKQKAQEQEQIAKAKEEERKTAAIKRENCSRAQDNLRLLQDGVRINRVNDKGERVILDDKQRAEEMQRSRAVISTECK